MEDDNLYGWLSSLEAIAKYLGRSKRTIQRWMKDGLPVLRDPAGNPIAKASHIDNYMMDMNRRKSDSGEWNYPGIETALEYEDARVRHTQELEEKLIHAQRLPRSRF